MTNTKSKDKKLEASKDGTPTAYAINHMFCKLIENGVKPDVVAIKGTEYQKLLRELDQPEPTIFGMKIIIKSDDFFPDNTNIIVANNMSTYPPIDPIIIKGQSNA